MRTRIGLAVGRGAVRAVAIRGQRIVWAGEMPLASVAEFEDTLAALLATAPRSRWLKPVVHAAIGPHAAQVKRVTGLPEAADGDALAAIVREAAGTYFLKNGVQLLTTRVRQTEGGPAIAAALDRPYVDAIRAACRTRRWQTGPIAPTAIALTHAYQDAAFVWNDGALTIEVFRNGSGSLESVRTRPARPEDVAATSFALVPGLAALGEEARRFADAFGATALQAHEPLAVHADRHESHTFALPRRSLIVATAIVATGVLTAGLSPLAAKWAGQRALAHVHQLRPGRLQVISTSLTQLDRVSAILRQARSFADDRTSVSALLGELARLLPEHSAVLAFEWTSTESRGRGEITIVTANPTAALGAVRRLPGVTNVELVGGVSRQSIAGQDLQRVTIRFVGNGR